MSSPDVSPTTNFSANARPVGTAWVTDPNAIVRDTHPDEPPLQGLRLSLPEPMTEHPVPEVVQSRRNA